MGLTKDLKPLVGKRLLGVGSGTTAESLIGFHCEQLVQLIGESSNADDNYIQEMQTVQS